MNKLLSIIVPSCNMEKYLDRCLSSFIVNDKELLDKLDVIVVNDGSKDRTSEIAHGWEAKYLGVVRVIDKQNGHYGSCVNAALKIVNGIFVKLLDADDFYNKSEFEKYLYTLDKFVSNNPAPDVVFNDAAIVYNAGKTVPFLKLGFPVGMNFPDELVFNSHAYLQMQKLAYRTELLKSIGYCQTEGIAYTDNEWMFYPLLAVKTCVYIPNQVYIYFIGRAGQSMTPAAIGRSAPALIKMVARMHSYLSSSEFMELPAFKQRYAVRFERGLLAGTYVNALLKLDNKETNEVIASAEELLQKEFPSLYREASELSFPSSTRLKFHYVLHYRKFQSYGKLYQYAYKLAWNILVKIGKLS